MIELIDERGPVDTFRDQSGKALLLKLMPVRLFHRAANAPNAGKSATWRVAPLFVRWRIVIFEHGKAAQVRKHLVPFVDQEERFLTIAHEHPGTMRKLILRHKVSLCGPAEAASLAGRGLTP